jgi:nitrite reductase/ring-hydroxylating ferredoxin subunit/uncharacterized membrane protein
MLLTDLARRLERIEGLDPVVDAVTKVVNRVLPEGPTKDALHGKWLGHQLHPLLVAMPIGMYSSAVLLDLTGGSAEAARRLVGAGVLSVVPTAWAGLADWSELGDFRRPRRVGLLHAGFNVTSTLLFGASWWARGNGNQARGKALALAGLAALGGGGYLGGHLSYSQGVGVNRNADRAAEPTEWTDAVAASEVRDGQLRRVDVEGQPVLLTRQGGRLLAIGAVCSHYGGPLEDGELDGSCVVCPWHGSEFDLADGSVVRGPATVPQQAYDVRTVGERIEVKARI